MKKIVVALCALAMCATVPVGAQNTLWQKYTDAGVKAYNQGKYLDAERLFKESLVAAEAAGDEGGIRMERSVCNLGTVYKEEAKYDEAEKMFRRAIQMIEKGNRVQKADMPMALNNLAGVHIGQGRFTEALALYEDALKMAEKRFGHDSPNTVLQKENLCYLLINFGEYKRAALLLQDLMDCFKTQKSHQSQYFAVFIFDAGYLAKERGQYEAAEKLYKQALKEGATSFGTTHKYYANAMQALAELYAIQGRYDEAEKLLKDALEVKEKSGGADHPEMATTLNEMAKTYIAAGRYADAEPICRRAMEINERSLGPDHAQAASTLDVMAQIYQQRGDYAEAERLIRRALNVRERAFAAGNPRIRESYKNLGILYLEKGDLTAAEEQLNRALKMGDREKIGGLVPEMAEIMTALGRCYMKQDKLDQAEQLYTRALEDTEKTFGRETSQYADRERQLATVVALKKDHVRAIKLMEEVVATDGKTAGDKSAKMAADLELLSGYYEAAGAQPERVAELNARAAAIKQALPGARFVAKADADTAGGAAGSGVLNAATPVADKWALVVGISSFKDPSINLKFATKDAIDFRNFLVNNAHFQPDHVKLLTDGAATREDIIGLLGDKWLGRVAHPDDLVVVYISSHGSSAQQQAGGVNFLVAHDTRKDSLLATGIPMQWLTNIVKDQIHSDRVVLILDVCHGAAAAGGEGSKALVRSNGVDVDGLSLGKGQAVLCSSLADQLSWESKAYQNSVFTRRLIEALACNGEKTTLTEAYRYLRDTVESEVLHDRGELQTPILNAKQWQGADAVISIKPTKPRSSVVK